MEDATHHKNDSSYSCDTSMFQSDDLSMYADIIDELCQEPAKPRRRGKIYSRCYRRPSWSSTSEHHSSASPSSGSDIDEPSSSLNQFNLDYSNINSEFSDIFSYFDKEVDFDESVADCIEDTSSPSPSPSATENTTEDEAKKPAESFRCQVKNVIYKKHSNTLRPNNSGRLRSLVNLFENCNIEQKAFDDKQKSENETTMNQINNGSVKKIVQLYQKQMQEHQNTTLRKSHREQPSTPTSGKFDLFRNSLENFFRDRCCFKEERSENHPIRSQNNVRPSSLEKPSTDGIDNMLIKYNRLKTMKTFLENHNAMKHCHEVCTNMSDRLLDGIEDTIVAHEDQMYKYFEKLAVNSLVHFSHIAHHFRLFY